MNSILDNNRSRIVEWFDRIEIWTVESDVARRVDVVPSPTKADCRQPLAELKSIVI